MTGQDILNAAIRSTIIRVTFGVACLGIATHVAHGTELHQGLVGYWPLDDGAGETASDGFGVELDLGSLRNEPFWLGADDAKLGDSALWFDGLEQDVLIPASNDLDIGTNAVSVSAWVNLDIIPSELQESFGGIFDSADDNYILYLDRSNQELRFKVTDVDGNAERPGVPESLLIPQTWHHVLGVYNGAEGVAKIYFNGEPIDAHVNESLDGLVRPGQIASIGANPTLDPGNPSTRFFPGAVDDVGVWNRPLGRAEASYLYNSGIGTAIGAANPDIEFITDTPPVEPTAPTVEPLIHYEFEGNLLNSGSGGSDLDGILFDTPEVNNDLYTAGKVGQALDLRENPISQEFDGDSVGVDYVLPDSGTIIFDYTVNEYYNFQSLWTNSIDANDWEMWIFGDGVLRGRVDGNSAVQFDLDNLSGTGETYEIAFTWERDDDNVSVQLFIDGEQRDQDLVGNWVDPGETVFIGGGDDRNHFGNGIWDEFRIYDSALSAGEILYLSSGPDDACDPASDGDLDGNGIVGFADFLALSANFGNTVDDHTFGDIDCNGTVDFADFLTLSANFGNTVGEAATVPEPSGLALLSLASLFGSMVRHSRRSR